MPTINLETKISAPLRTVFDCSRNIDLHKLSAKSTKEDAIAGVKNGFINLGEQVTWRARHFGIYFVMTVKITEMNPPDFFMDEMVRGPFKRLVHKHFFEDTNGDTLMRDEFYFESPFGLLGKLVDRFILKSYLEKFLIKRNGIIKQIAENGYTKTK